MIDPRQYANKAVSVETIARVEAQITEALTYLRALREASTMENGVQLASRFDEMNPISLFSDPTLGADFTELNSKVRKHYGNLSRSFRHVDEGEFFKDEFQDALGALIELLEGK